MRVRVKVRVGVKARVRASARVRIGVERHVEGEDEREERREEKVPRHHRVDLDIAWLGLGLESGLGLGSEVPRDHRYGGRPCGEAEGWAWAAAWYRCPCRRFTRPHQTLTLS